VPVVATSGDGPRQSFFNAACRDTVLVALGGNSAGFHGNLASAVTAWSATH
jgi:hypothetical protein